jgi:hypothetical protein
VGEVVLLSVLLLTSHQLGFNYGLTFGQLSGTAGAKGCENKTLDLGGSCGNQLKKDPLPLPPPIAIA